MFENGKKTDVLIVDDSPLIVEVVKNIIETDQELNVMGTANNPYEAAKLIAKQKPDVIILDIQMPRMDGLTFLKKIMSQHPIPVVIFSGVAEKGSRNALLALSYGAVEILQKPKSIFDKDFKEKSKQFCQTIKAAAAAQGKLRLLKSYAPTKEKYSADVILEKRKTALKQPPAKKIVAIGASTGGTQALEKIISELPATVPGIVIVQHMPGNFTNSFAERLNSISKVCVKEAEHGDVIREGCVLIANGFYHLLVKHAGNNYFAELKNGPLVNRHKPSVDVLFRSVSHHAGSNATGILLTGMGDDGAKGLLEMRESGAVTIAQDEASSLVFGMPREAIKIGAAKKVYSLDRIINYLISLSYPKKL